MKPRMPLGDFLVAYLQKLGVTHLFGIPGDLVMRLFLRFGRRRGLHIVTMSHEPGVGFAADGYARATGRIGVVCVTYGAGGHNMVNPVAGSFSERVPILVISGGPGRGGAQARHAHPPPGEGDRVAAAHLPRADLRRARDRRPGHGGRRHRRGGARDVGRPAARLSRDPPRHGRARDRGAGAPADWNGRLPERRSDPRKVREAARETAARLNAARAPVVIAGIECHRYHLTRELLRLVERSGAPCVTTVLAKGAIPMDHPQHMGVYIGAISPRADPRAGRRAPTSCSISAPCSPT